MASAIPLIISPENTAPLPYSIVSLPKEISTPVLSYQSYGQQPIALIACAALANISLACQTLANVARDRLLVSPISIYFILAASSGERKSMICFNATTKFTIMRKFGAGMNHVSRLCARIHRRSAFIHARRCAKKCGCTEIFHDIASGGKLVFHMFSALAEFERDLIIERTHAGLKAARARGRMGTCWINAKSAK